jgi:hypothetical protein
MKADNIKPNKLVLNAVLETGIREGDTDLVYTVLKDFLAIGHEPYENSMKHLSNLKKLPDHLYTLIKKNFKDRGIFDMKVRPFEHPTIGGPRDGHVKAEHNKKYSRVKQHRRQGKPLAKKVKRGLKV